jgi:type VI secretion system protein ImpC
MPKPHPRQAELAAKVDSAIGVLMRRILHHPDFQAIEAAWRGLYFLVSQLETDENLKLYLLDISKTELAADLSGTDDISATGVYKLLVKQTAELGNGGLGLLAGNFTFDRSRKMRHVAVCLVVEGAGAPFIAAHPHLLGCEPPAETPDPGDWRLPDDDPTREARRFESPSRIHRPRPSEVFAPFALRQRNRSLSLFRGSGNRTETRRISMVNPS